MGYLRYQLMQDFWTINRDPIDTVVIFFLKQPYVRTLEPRKKPSYFPLYWLVDRDPYNSLLYSPYNWIVFHPLYNPTSQGFSLTKTSTTSVPTNFPAACVKQKPCMSSNPGVSSQPWKWKNNVYLEVVSGYLVGNWLGLCRFITLGFGDIFDPLKKGLF